MSDDRGAIVPKWSNASCGMTIRSSALFCTGWIRRQLLDVATLLPACPIFGLDGAAGWTLALQGDDVPSHVGLAVRPFHGIEDMRANRAIRIKDGNRAVKDRFKSLSDIKPLGFAADQTDIGSSARAT